MYRQGDSFPGKYIVKVGTLDSSSALNDAKPAVELFAPERISWVSEISGAAQKPAMP